MINSNQADALQSIQDKLTASGWDWKRCVTEIGCTGEFRQNAWLHVESMGRVVATLAADKRGEIEVKSAETTKLASILRQLISQLTPETLSASTRFLGYKLTVFSG